MRVFDRVFIIIFENQLRDAVLANAYMKSLAARGTSLGNYSGVTHPSQPNYIASIAGSPCGVIDDSLRDIAARNLVDLLEAKGVSWKAYIQDLPANKTVKSKGLYYRKHNPFISFDDIRNQPARLARIVNATELQTDVANNTLPQYSWYTPNIQNDGHTPPASFDPHNPARNVNFLAKFLQALLEPLLKKPNFTTGTLIVVTFDESIPYDNNQVYTVLLGDMVQPGAVISEAFNHYSLLRTVEDNFDLGTLNGDDSTAAPFRFLWGIEPPAFDWANHSQPADEP